MERRDVKGTCEVRDTPNGRMITGYAAVFNRDSSDLGFIEQIDPGAFNRTLSQADVRGLVNHDPNQLIGRTKSGTMRLSTDQVGLRYEIDINTADPDGQRVLAKVQRGDLDGASFSFNTIRDEWNWQAEPPQRRLMEVKLLDCGPVVFPAYPDATAAARALEPIAEKINRPVDDLVTALKTGEIRSMIETPIETEAEERAVWSTAYVNDLADSAFLHIEKGGKKDSDGKTTPRSLRHFPYKDANGNIDLPHLRNALARIPQSDLPQSVKDEVAAKAEKILAAQKNSFRDALNDEIDDLEERAGKTISAATAAKLRAAMQQLRDLLDMGDDAGEDENLLDKALEMDSHKAESESRLSLEEAELQLRERELAVLSS